MLNKKGLGYGLTMLLVAVAVLLLLTKATFLSVTIEPPTIERELGAESKRLLESYDERERILFKVDEVSKYGRDEAIVSLANSGGLSDSNCRQGNYFKWDSECNPFESLEDNYEFYFEQSFNRYEVVEFEVDYDLNFADNFVIGNTDDEIILDIEGEGRELEVYGQDPINKDLDGSRIGVYAFEPSFKMEFDYDFNDYEIILEAINTCLSQDINLCNGDYFGFNWEQDKRDNIVRFDVETDYDVRVLKNDEIIEEPVVIRFLVDIDNFNLG